MYDFLFPYSQLLFPLLLLQLYPLCSSVPHNTPLMLSLGLCFSPLLPPALLVFLYPFVPPNLLYADFYTPFNTGHHLELFLKNFLGCRITTVLQIDFKHSILQNTSAKGLLSAFLHTSLKEKGNLATKLWISLIIPGQIKQHLQRVYQMLKIKER